MRWKFKQGESELDVELLHTSENAFRFRVGKEEVTIENPKIFPYSIETADFRLSLEAWTPQKWRAVNGDRTFILQPQSLEAANAATSGEIRTQMPGRVLKVLVEKGQAVKAKQTLLILEAMKMENEIRAEADAVVGSIEVSAGQSLESGALLIKMATE